MPDDHALLILQAQYAVNIEQYQKEHPRPSRYEKVRDPAELKRPQSAYFFFLAEFREQFKVGLWHCRRACLLACASSRWAFAFGEGLQSLQCLF
jgi:hypothetical protein